MCGVCNHHHHKGTKCSVCGHVGRCNIFPKMKQRASDFRKITTTFYEAGNIQRDGQWEMLVLMRTAIYCGEMNIPSTEEFVPHQEAACRHFVTYVGDAPALCGRYHLAKATEGHDIAIVDRFGVLPQFRLRGLSRQCLPQLVRDVGNASSGSVREIVFSVPANSSQHNKALTLGLRDTSITETRGGVAFTCLAQRLG